jgi:hypothetical protein
MKVDIYRIDGRTLQIEIGEEVKVSFELTIVEALELSKKIFDQAMRQEVKRK